MAKKIIIHNTYNINTIIESFAVMNNYEYEPLIEEEHMDISKEIALIRDAANSLRGKYTAEKYCDVIIPMVIIKRFECAFEKTKDAVVALFKEDPNTPQPFER